MHRGSLDNYKKINYLQLAAASFVTITAALLALLIFYKGRLFYYGDYMTQQIAFIKECRRVIRSGAPFWSWNTFLGANFLGTYSFYVYGSPFFWPLVFIPERFIAYGLSVMFILKHITACLSAFAYIKTKTARPHFAMIGALLYAFSGFTIDSTFYNHFIDVIALFPLIPLFVDKALDNRKKYLLSIAVFISAVTNYYFLIASSVFILFYLFFRVRYSDNRYTLKDALRCLVWYALGAAASAFILLPSAFSLLETDKAAGALSTSLLRAAACIPQIFKILKNIVLPSEGALGSATGFIYASFFSNVMFIPVFGALLLFCAVRQKGSREWDIRLVRFLFIATLIPGFNGIFSLFSNMNYTRWWYCFILVSVVASIHIFESFESDPRLAEKEYKKSAKAIIIISSLTVVLPALLKLLSGFIPKDFIARVLPENAMTYVYASKVFGKFDADDLRYMLVFLLMTAASYLSAFIMIRRGTFYKKPAVSVAAVVLVCALTYGAYITNDAYTYHKNNVQFVEENYYVNPSEEAADNTRYSARVSYGIKKDDHTPKDNAVKLDNYSMIINEPSVRTFNSFKSKATCAFARMIGYEIGSMPLTKAHYSTPAIECVLSIKSNLDSSLRRTDADHYAPMGYTYSCYVKNEGFDFTKDVKENNRRIELMTKACIVDDETAKELSGYISPLANESFDWREAAEKNKQTACTSVEMTTRGLSAESEGDEARLAYFSIPNDKGWKAYVNSKETEIYTLNGGFIGIILPPGRSHIEFRFTTPGLKAGIAISLFSAALTAALCVIDSKRNSASHKAQKRTENELK